MFWYPFKGISFADPTAWQLPGKSKDFPAHVLYALVLAFPLLEEKLLRPISQFII